MESLLRLNVREMEEIFSKVRASEVPSLFQPECHLQYEALLQEGKAWAEARIAPVLPKAAMEKLRSANAVALACYIYPNAAGRRAFTMVKFCYWVLTFDDVADDSLGNGGKAERLRRFCCSFLDAVFGGGGGGGGDGGDCLSEVEVLCVELAREWWGEMLQEGTETWAPPGLQARFSEAMTEYVMSQLRMAELRAAWTEWLQAPTATAECALPCSLEEMVTLWRRASSSYLVLVLVEYDLGIELDEESLATAAMQQLIDAASDHMNWVNNIVSLPKDMLKQETLNFLVLLHLHATGNTRVLRPLQATLEEAWEVVARLEQSCAEATMRIHTQQPPATLAACKFADATCTFTRSCFLWHFHSGRYTLTPPTSLHI